MRDEQQVVERGALLAEGDRLDVRVECQLHLGAGVGIELDDLSRIGPGDRPQVAVRIERQARDAQVQVAAVLGEGVGRRVEDLDALAGRDEDLVASAGSTASASVMPSPNWLTIAPVVGSSCRSGPPPVAAQRWPCAVEGHRIDLVGERGQRRAGRAAVLRDAEQLVARCAAADQEAAVGRLDERHRPQDAVALVEARGERLGLERLEHRL